MAMNLTCTRHDGLRWSVKCLLEENPFHLAVGLAVSFIACWQQPLACHGGALPAIRSAPGLGTDAAPLRAGL